MKAKVSFVFKVVIAASAVMNTVIGAVVPAYAQSTSQGTDVATSAQQSSNSTAMGAVVNGASAAALGYSSKAAFAAQHTSLGIMLAGMAALAASQSLMDLKQSGTDAGIAAQAACAGSLCTTDAGGSSSSGSGTAGGTDLAAGSGTYGSDTSAAGTGTLPQLSTSPLTLQAAQALSSDNAVLAAAAQNGVTYNPANNTVTTPSGTVPASALSSAAGMKAAGFNSNDINSAMNALADAKKIADQKLSALKADGLLDGSGGDSMQALQANRASEFNMNAYLAKLNGRKPASLGSPTVAGLSRKVASGESIGVSGDNIFDMIKRRYQHQRTLGNFLEH